MNIKNPICFFREAVAQIALGLCFSGHTRCEYKEACLTRIRTYTLVLHKTAYTSNLAHTYIHTHTHMHTLTHTLTHLLVHKDTITHTHVHTHTYTQAHAHTHSHRRDAQKEQQQQQLPPILCIQGVLLIIEASQTQPTPPLAAVYPRPMYPLAPCNTTHSPHTAKSSTSSLLPPPLLTMRGRPPILHLAPLTAMPTLRCCGCR